MKKFIVVYYSRTGNNKYLAEKLAKSLDCEIVVIRPKLNIFLLLMLSKNGFGINPLGVDLTQYDQVVLCGPVWMGKLVSPLRGFIQKHENEISRLYFGCCCASIDEDKEKKYGYAIVFQTLKDLLGDKCIHCEAFPVSLVVAEDVPKTSDTLMKVRLSDANFTGDIQNRLDGFVLKIQG